MTTDDTVEQLLNFGFTVVKYVLKEQGEFYPIGVYIDGDDKPQQLISFFGDDFPLSNELVKLLQSILEEKFAKNEIKGYAVFYDSISRRNAESEKLDTIIAKFKYKKFNNLYFLSYKIANSEITFHEGWME